MEETLRQKEAFEYYYGRGNSRSCRQVAEQFQVSERTVFNWSSQFKWQEKIRMRDIQNAQKLEQKTDDTILEARHKYLGLIKATLQKYEGALLSGDIKINSVNDLERLAHLEMELREKSIQNDGHLEVIIREATLEDAKKD